VFQAVYSFDCLRSGQISLNHVGGLFQSGGDALIVRHLDDCAT
jgi:hypothetical protein